MNDIPPKPYHQHIPHDPEDQSPISQAEEDISFFEKQIISLHNLMRAKKQLPSFDAVRRAAEEVDGLFAAQEFPVDLPACLQGRWPEYGERRVLAVETVLCELGYLSKADLRAALAESTDRPAPPSAATPYAPVVDAATYCEPRYFPGTVVQVAAHPPAGHIRTPVYLLGKTGVIVRLQGMFLSPEDLAHFKSSVVQLPLYLVEFAMADVWGDRCPPKSLKDKLRVEIYEPWLLPLD
ncbi:MAG: SH3-like domain-containing protein [Leptolyngbyaceae cyanobacterium]